jgi:hypothetical protein
MMTFEKEVTWATMELDSVNPDSGQLVEVEKKKILSFKELDKYDKSQAKFHFIIASIPNNMIETRDDYVIEPEFIYDLTIKFIDEMAIINENTLFTPNDKKELLGNSQSIYDLGSQLLKEKITPFFLKFRKISS